MFKPAFRFNLMHNADVISHAVCFPVLAIVILEYKLHFTSSVSFSLVKCSQTFELLTCIQPSSPETNHQNSFSIYFNTHWLLISFYSKIAFISIRKQMHVCAQLMWFKRHDLTQNIFWVDFWILKFADPGFIPTLCATYTLYAYPERCAVWPQGQQGWTPRTWWGLRRSPGQSQPPGKEKSP